MNDKELNHQVSFEDTSIAFSSKDDKELKKMYLLFASMNNNILVNLGTNLMKTAIKLNLPVKQFIKKTIFQHFCGGETIEDSQSTIEELAKYNIGTILDYSVEGEKTEEGFEKTATEIIKTINKAKSTSYIPFTVFKITGLASAELLEKVQKKEKLQPAEIQAFDKIKARVEKICKTAHDLEVRIFIDGEESWIQEVIDELAYQMMEKYNLNTAIVFNTYQMYRKDMMGKLRNAFHYAVAGNYFLGVKLVRGAYMEKERERAEEVGYEDPIQPQKDATDQDYDKALKFCIDNKQRIYLCSGSHNEYSNYYLTILMEKHGMKNNDGRVWFAQLYGMSDNISFNLANAGYNVAKYVPYGPVEAVMPYLLRRAEENTSISGQSSREFTLIKSELKRRKKAKSR
ncbi:proline dehydrogenase family protein [soil metagenome]